MRRCHMVWLAIAVAAVTAAHVQAASPQLDLILPRGGTRQVKPNDQQSQDRQTTRAQTMHQRLLCENGSPAASGSGRHWRTQNFV